MTPKRVTITSGVHLRDLAPGQLHRSDETSQRWRDAGDTANLTGLGIEPPTSRTISAAFNQYTDRRTPDIIL